MSEYQQITDSVSETTSFISDSWIYGREFMLGAHRDMKFLAIGAMQMSQSSADRAFWQFVHDSCDFGDLG